MVRYYMCSCWNRITRTSDHEKPAVSGVSSHHRSHQTPCAPPLMPLPPSQKPEIKLSRSQTATSQRVSSPCPERARTIMADWRCTCWSAGWCMRDGRNIKYKWERQCWASFKASGNTSHIFLLRLRGPGPGSHKLLAPTDKQIRKHASPFSKLRLIFENLSRSLCY